MNIESTPQDNRVNDPLVSGWYSNDGRPILETPLSGEAQDLLNKAKSIKPYNSINRMPYQAPRSAIIALALSNKTASFLTTIISDMRGIYIMGLTELIMEYIDAVYQFDCDVSQQQYLDSCEFKRDYYNQYILIDDFVHGIDQYYFDLTRSINDKPVPSIFTSTTFKKYRVEFIRQAIYRLYPNAKSNYKLIVGIDYIAEKAVIEKGKYQSTETILNGFTLLCEIDGSDGI